MDNEQFLLEYLDKKYMMPLHTYLNKQRSKAEYGDFPLETEGLFNGYVLHFTRQPMKIFQEGFRGIAKEEMKHLEVTHYDDSVSHILGEGYVFVYDVNDIGYNVDLVHSVNLYGHYAILFKSAGVKVFHNGDEEYQVIINGTSNLRDSVLLRFRETETAQEEKEATQSGSGVITEIIDPKSGYIIKTSPNFSNVVNWIKNNYSQYRNKISGESRKKLINQYLKQLQNLFAPITQKYGEDKVKITPTPYESFSRIEYFAKVEMPIELYKEFAKYAKHDKFAHNRDYIGDLSYFTRESYDYTTMTLYFVSNEGEYKSL